MRTLSREEQHHVQAAKNLLGGRGNERDLESVLSALSVWGRQPLGWDCCARELMAFVSSLLGSWSNPERGCRKFTLICSLHGKPGLPVLFVLDVGKADAPGLGGPFVPVIIALEHNPERGPFITGRLRICTPPGMTGVGTTVRLWTGWDTEKVHPMPWKVEDINKRLDFVHHVWEHGPQRMIGRECLDEFKATKADLKALGLTIARTKDGHYMVRLRSVLSLAQTHAIVDLRRRQQQQRNDYYERYQRQPSEGDDTSASD